MRGLAWLLLGAINIVIAFGETGEARTSLLVLGTAFLIAGLWSVIRQHTGPPPNRRFAAIAFWIAAAVISIWGAINGVVTHRAGVLGLGLGCLAGSIVILNLAFRTRAHRK